MIKVFSPGSTARHVTINTLAQVVGKFFTAGATILISFIIARWYGAEGYGEFTKITTYVALFYLLADFGFNAIYLQRSPNETNPDIQWQSLLAVRLIAGFSLIFIALSILSFLPEQGAEGYTVFVRLGIILFIPTILFQAILTTANAYFQKRLLYSRSTIAVGLGSFTSLLFLFWVTKQIYYSQGIITMIMGLTVGSLVMAISSLYFVRKLRQPVTPLFSITKITPLVLATIPFGLTLLFNVVYFRVDSIILTLVRSTAEVGIYGLAYKIFELVLIIPTFFMNALYPIMLRAREKNMDGFTRLLKKSAIILFGVSACGTIVMWIAAPYVTWVKPDFYGSINAIRILAMGLPFFFLSSLTMWALIAMHKQKTLLIIYGVSMAVTVLCDIWFIPIYGYVGAAVITVLSEGLVFFLSVFFLRRRNS